MTDTNTVQIKTILEAIRRCPEAEIVHPMIEECLKLLAPAPEPEPAAPMPAKPFWLVGYAYDVPHYLDFTVQADTEEQALALAQSALDAGHFSSHAGTVSIEDFTNERVFGGSLLEPEDAGDHPTLTELIASN